MSRTTVAALLVVALAAMAAAYVFLGSSNAERPEEEPVALEPAEPELFEPGPGDSAEEEATRGWSVTLYYPGQDGLLHPEERRLATENLLPPEEVTDQVELVVRALLAGPRNGALRAPLPRDTDLLGVEVQLEEKIAWIDLGPRRAVSEDAEDAKGGNGAETEAQAQAAAQEVPSALQGGSKQELLTVYSVVSSVALSLDAVERVGLLWNGSQGSTFAGHVDITRPLRANQRYLARR